MTIPTPSAKDRETARELAQKIRAEKPHNIQVLPSFVLSYDGAEEAIATALANEREACAKIADLYAEENIRLAGDTILHDPVLSGRSRAPEAFDKSAELIIEGNTHSAMFHAAQNIASAIRSRRYG